LHDSGIYEALDESASARTLSDMTARRTAHLKANFQVLDYFKFYDPTPPNLM